MGTSMDKCTEAAKRLRDENFAVSNSWVADLLRKAEAEKHATPAQGQAHGWPQTPIKRPFPGQQMQQQQAWQNGFPNLNGQAWQKGGRPPWQNAQQPPWQ